MKTALSSAKNHSTSVRTARRVASSAVRVVSHRTTELASIRELVRTARPHVAEVANARGNAYLYLYDSFVRESPHKDVMRIVEKRFVDFGLSGKVIRITPFTNCRSLIEDELRYGVKTVVIVGNDETVAKVMSRAADLDVVFGLIPIGKKGNDLAESLGIPLNEESCNTLAARKIELLDYGVINNQRFFLTSLHIKNARLRITCDNTFVVKADKDNVELAVSNLLPSSIQGAPTGLLHPQDGRLEVFIRPQVSGVLSGLFNRRVYSKPSVFAFRRLLVSAARPFDMATDGRETQESSVEITVASKKLKMIVGKERRF
ncbi:MAG: hypothetical protein HY981_02285 [Candidatus Magasanikbacteria bacterium]|nr:hypothetical protein [Candidatus Magasanikbacteria bacterium]